MDDDIADNNYLNTMERRSGIFHSEDFAHPYMAEMTENARDVVKQLRDKYNAGDWEVKKEVREFEKNQWGNLFTKDAGGQKAFEDQFASGDKLRQGTAWELF